MEESTDWSLTHWMMVSSSIRSGFDEILCFKILYWKQYEVEVSELENVLALTVKRTTQYQMTIEQMQEIFSTVEPP